MITRDNFDYFASSAALTASFWHLRLHLSSLVCQFLRPRHHSMRPGPAPAHSWQGAAIPKTFFSKRIGKKKNYRIENWNSEELWDYRHFQRIENTWWAENGDAFVCRSLSRRLSGRSSRFDPWTCQASPCWSAKTEHEDGENMWKPMKNIHQFARYSSNQH